MIRPTEEGFERLAPPRKGEWRSLFHESEQTFDSYASRHPRSRPGDRSALVVQPLGGVAERHPGLLDRMREYGEAFFGCSARVAPPVPLDSKAYLPQRRQYNSSMLLDELAARVPAEAAIYLCLTDQDLFSRGKKYVFGEGNPLLRAGICSMSRLEASDPSFFVRRALRLMTHESGHILGIAHCVTHRCVMQGSNTLEESDGQPLHLCPEDLRKLTWRTGVDRLERYGRLQHFYLKMGWVADASWTAAQT
jgi:archaemetzincin